MSLNWKEIDAVLEELPLKGSFVQGIVQPAFDALILRMYHPGTDHARGKAWDLFISLASGGCRIHATERAAAKTEKPLRFMEFLKKRAKGALVSEARQLGSERIVRLDLLREGEALILWIRLWSNAANVILTDAAGTIQDCMMRRPKRGEISGGRYSPEPSAPDQSRPPKEFVLRDFPGEGSLSERIEAYYDSSAGALSVESLLPRLESLYSQRIGKLEGSIQAMRARLADFAQSERWREYGDLLMSIPEADTASGLVELDDFFRPGERVAIAVEPGVRIADAARAWYEKAHKAKTGRAEVERELAAAERELMAVNAELEGLRTETDPLRLERVLAAHRPQAAQAPKGLPGILIQSRGWTIIVGRTAKENDELLRRHVRGSDLWLHARDWAGAYVFVKAQRGKTVPLDVLLDAGNLALYHSKARSAGEADLYYTQVKYLRRAKDGPLGLVLPTQEKNLRVKLDPERMQALREGEEGA